MGKGTYWSWCGTTVVATWGLGDYLGHWQRRGTAILEQKVVCLLLTEGQTSWNAWSRLVRAIEQVAVCMGKRRKVGAHVDSIGKGWSP